MKYELTDETVKTLEGVILHRVKSLDTGILGGFIES
jgi:hypothetical protein